MWIGTEGGSEEGELGVEEAEGEAMMRGGAVCGDGGSMIGSGVAFVFRPVVGGELAHEGVS